MTEYSTQPHASPVPEIQEIGIHDIRAILSLGWADFWAAPLFGIFFSLIYVIGGWVMFLIYYEAGQTWWGIPFVVGFPLIAPFAAVGLYEVSRRMERNEQPRWGAVLGVIFAERNRQVPWLGALMMFWFMFWVFIAHGIFAIVMGLSALTHITTSLDTLLTGKGLILLVAEMGLGGFFAFVVFALTAVSLPLLLDREIDFVTAMILSAKVVSQNLRVMLAWAFIIAILLFIGMMMGFLGLLIIMPILGHATWHLYRRVLSD